MNNTIGIGISTSRKNNGQGMEKRVHHEGDKVLGVGECSETRSEGVEGAPN